MTDADDMRELRDILAKITPNCSYDAWYRIARAVYAELGEDGFDLFHEWSKGTLHGIIAWKYSGLRSCRYQWEHSKRLTRINIGTLYLYAQRSEDGERI